MRRRRLLPAILIAAALLRAAWTVLVSPAAFLEVDGTDYRDIAQNISAGRGFAASAPRWFEPAALLPPGPHPDFARPPLVPLLGALLYRLPGPWEIWARAVMVIAGTLAVWLVYRVATAVDSERGGIAAAALFALQPYAIFYSGRWSTETPFAVLVLGSVWMLASRHQRPTVPLFLGGLFAGLAALARPTGLALIPALTTWVLLLPAVGNRRAAARRRASRAILFLAAAALPLLPWAARNHAATGAWNPATFFGGYNHWAGMNDRVVSLYRGDSHHHNLAQVDTLFHHDTKKMVREMEALTVVGPIAEARFWRTAARDWIRSHPGRAAEIVLRRTLHYFRIAPGHGVLGSRERVAALFLWPVHLLALAALWFHRRRLPWLLLIPPVAGLAASLPFVFSLRLRYPFLDPYAVILAGGMLATWWEWPRKRHGISIDAASPL